jgi:hypothetical protein
MSKLRVDLGMYVRAIPLLLRRPSIFVIPLLAAVLELLLTQVSYLFTDPLGGQGAGLFAMLIQLVYLWAFGIAIIQANNIWRTGRGSFDEAWEEGRAKFGAIALAAIGFQFVVWAASFIGSYLGDRSIFPDLHDTIGRDRRHSGKPGHLRFHSRRARAAGRVDRACAGFLRDLVRRGAHRAAVRLTARFGDDRQLYHRRRARGRVSLPRLPVRQAVRRRRV